MSASSALGARVHRTLYSKSRITVISAVLFMVLIAFSVAVLRVTPPPSVAYGVEIIAPYEHEVCAGGTIRYPVVIDVPADSLPDQITPAESWCLVGGTCKTVKPANMEEDANDSPVLKPRSIRIDAKRQVPAYLAPGVYEFWHSTKDAHGNVAAYSVEPITVKVCP